MLLGALLSPKLNLMYTAEAYRIRVYATTSFLPSPAPQLAYSCKCCETELYPPASSRFIVHHHRPYNISHLASTRMSCKHEKINGNFVKSCSVNPKRESRPGFISAACICVGLQIITLKSQVGHVVCL